MKRDTSRETYEQIQAEGLLSSLRNQAYRMLYEFGPCTGGELMAQARELHPEWTDAMVHNFEKRLSELEELGVARTLDKRPCSISGRVCLVWDVTSGLPKPPPKRQNKDDQIQLLQKRITELEVENAELRRQLPKQTEMFVAPQADPRMWH